MAHAIILCGHARVSYSTKPAGGYVLANIFRNLGFRAIVLDHIAYYSEKSRNALIAKFVTEETKFICVSTTLFGKTGAQFATIEQIDEIVKPIVDECRKRSPTAVAIVGGSQVTSGAISTLNYEFAVKGQGETSIVAIINHVLYGDPIEGDKIGDTLYLDDKVYGYEGFNSSTNLRFTDQDAVVSGETIPLEFGRGCVFKCSYCTYQLTGKDFSDFTRSKDLLIGDFKHNYEKFGSYRYILTDDTINDSIQKAKIWSEAVKSVDIPIEFGGYMRLELFQRYPEMADLYIEAGLRGVVFGIETFNKVAGSAVGKGFGEKAKEVLQKLRDKWKDRVHIQCNFILGLPHDTFDDLWRQQEWLETSNVVDRASFLPLYITKTGSILSKEFESYYTEIPPFETTDEYWISHFKHKINWKSPVMTFSEAQELMVLFRSRWGTLFPSIANRYGSFSIMSMLQYYSLQNLRHITELNLPEIAKLKANDYYKQIMNVVEPKTGLPEIRPIPVQAHSNVFVPKINRRTIKIIEK
jgi:radical SAM superfamily enzyme YgiQ (UPF0313 family)